MHKRYVSKQEDRKDKKERKKDRQKRTKNGIKSIQTNINEYKK